MPKIPTVQLIENRHCSGLAPSRLLRISPTVLVPNPRRTPLHPTYHPACGCRIVVCVFGPARVYNIRHQLAVRRLHPLRESSRVRKPDFLTHTRRHLSPKSKVMDWNTDKADWFPSPYAYAGFPISYQPVTPPSSVRASPVRPVFFYLLCEGLTMLSLSATLSRIQSSHTNRPSSQRMMFWAMHSQLRRQARTHCQMHRSVMT